MDCKNVRLLYTVFRDGSVDEELKKEVLNHIKKCKSCRRLFETMYSITSCVKTYKPLVPEVGVFGKILERIETVPRRKTLLEVRWVLAYVFIFLFIAGFSFGIIRRINTKKQMIAKKKQEELFKRKDKYIMDYGQFEKGQVIYTIPAKDNSVKMVEISY